MPQRFVNLRRWYVALGFLHAVQALAILLIAGDFAITITSNFPVGPPGTLLEMPQGLFDLAVGPAVAIFLALKVYLVLSLAAKSLLAWQIYGGSLAN